MRPLQLKPSNILGNASIPTYGYSLSCVGPNGRVDGALLSALGTQMCVAIMLPAKHDAFVFMCVRALSCTLTFTSLGQFPMC